MWAWIEASYHVRPHSALQGLIPRARWQQDLLRIRPLGAFAKTIDALFYHRHQRKVRKDGTVAFAGKRFEVPYELTGRTLTLVVDPHLEQALWVESKTGAFLGEATPLDLIANNQRRRCRAQAHPEPQTADVKTRFNAVNMAYERYYSETDKTEQTH